MRLLPEFTPTGYRPTEVCLQSADDLLREIVPADGIFLRLRGGFYRLTLYQRLPGEEGPSLLQTIEYRGSTGDSWVPLLLVRPDIVPEEVLLEWALYQDYTREVRRALTEPPPEPPPAPPHPSRTRRIRTRILGWVNMILGDHRE